MSTKGLAAAPERTRYAILGAIALYFVLIVAAIFANVAYAAFAAEVLFGLIAIGLGVVFVRMTVSESGITPLKGAGVSLLVAGAAQLGYVFTLLAVLEAVSFVGILAGVGLYAYAVWIAD